MQIRLNGGWPGFFKDGDIVHTYRKDLAVIGIVLLFIWNVILTAVAFGARSSNAETMEIAADQAERILGVVVKQAEHELALMDVENKVSAIDTRSQEYKRRLGSIMGAAINSLAYSDPEFADLYYAMVQKLVQETAPEETVFVVNPNLK